MSKRKRRHLSAEFKARIAKEALQESKPIHEIAKENDIAPTQVSAWKKELEERMVEIFGLLQPRKRPPAPWLHDPVVKLPPSSK